MLCSKNTPLFAGINFYPYICFVPIHVHVQNSDGKAKIDVLTGVILENNGLKPRDLKKAEDAVRLYREDFIKAWNEYFDE